MKQKGMFSCRNYYDIHGLLKVGTDITGYVPDYFREPSVRNLDLLLSSGTSSPEILTETCTKIAHGLYCCEYEKLVVSTISLLAFKATWAVKRLLGKPTEVYISPTYRMLSKTLLKMPISTVFPDHAFIQMIMHIKLLYNAHTFLVGACFEPNDTTPAIIISSMGDIGKTSTIFQALKEIGGKYLSDDMIIVNKEGTVFSYPKPIRIRRINVPLVALERYVDPIQIVGSKERIKRESKAGTLCFLEHATENEVKPLDREDALAKVLAINRKLLPYFMERTLLAYSYMNPQFSLSKIMQKEAEILRQLLKHVDCYVLKCSLKNPKGYVELLRNLINEHI